MTAAPRPAPRTLPELVADRRHELGGANGPLSLRELVKRAGGTPGLENWRLIANGTHRGGFSDAVAEGIARALSVPVRVVFEAAGLPVSVGPWQLPERFSRVPVRDRRRVEAVLDSLLEAYERGVQDGRGL